MEEILEVSNAWQIRIPSRELTYPTWGKGKSSSKCHFWGDMLISWRVNPSQMLKKHPITNAHSAPLCGPSGMSYREMKSVRKMTQWQVTQPFLLLILVLILHSAWCLWVMFAWCDYLSVCLSGQQHLKNWLYQHFRSWQHTLWQVV